MHALNEYAEGKLGKTKKARCSFEKKNQYRKKQSAYENQLFSHKTPTKNWRKIVILMSKPSNFEFVKIKVWADMLGFEAKPSASEPCYPTHWAMGTIGTSGKYQ